MNRTKMMAEYEEAERIRFYMRRVMITWRWDIITKALAIPGLSAKRRYKLLVAWSENGQD